MSTIHAPDDTLKMLRETLCAAQSAFTFWPGHAVERQRHVERLQRLIDDIDRKRTPNGNSAGQPPADVWVGMVEGEWPVVLFTAEAHAVHWLNLADVKRQRVWKARLVLGPEVRVVNPQAYLEEVEGPGTIDLEEAARAGEARS